MDIEPVDPFNSLSEEAVLEIFRHMDLKTLLQQRQVNKRMKRLAEAGLKDAYREADRIRAERISKANPEMSDWDFAHELVNSIKKDFDSFGIQTINDPLLNPKELPRLEHEIQEEAPLVQFAQLLTEKIQLDFNLTRETTTSEKAKEIRDYLSNPENNNKLQSIDELNLGFTNLKILPSEIENFTSLKRLILCDTEITKLPESIGNLSSLYLLNLTNTELTELPESIGNLSRLEELYLKNTQITKLPESFGKLTSLQMLFVAGLTLDEESKQILSNLEESGTHAVQEI